VAPSIRKKLALTSLTSGGRSVGIVRFRTETIEFSFMRLNIYTVNLWGRSDGRGLLSLLKANDLES
jgi:hypothetical protein